ncbi:MAG: hypothetical protein ACJ72I_23215, partial [Pseudonocardiaceae bacterium]
EARPQRCADCLHDNDAPATSAFASVQSLAGTPASPGRGFPRAAARVLPLAARAVVKARRDGQRFGAAPQR